jgi:aminoglycoside/choline kinase family phosphotransferase
MSRQPSVPRSADDDTGTTWRIHRVWFDRSPGDYLLEVLTPGRRGVRGAHFRDGHFELVPLDDPQLPALRAEAQHGEFISYRPHRRAVIKAEGCYIKIFRPGEAVEAAERCAQMHTLLDPGAFTVPRILRASGDTLVFSALPGQPLHAVGADHSAPGDESFASAWEKWSRAWITQLSAPYDTATRSVFDTLPIHSPEVEAAAVWRRLNRWMRHYENVPDLSPQASALRAVAEEVTRNLLATAPDPLVLAHGDLHENQILVGECGSPLGLLDFDDAAQAEAALDLAILDVHLELRLRKNRMTPERYSKAHTEVLAVAEELQVSPSRFQAYSDAIWLRLACAALPSRSSQARAILSERISAASAAVRGSTVPCRSAGMMQALPTA